MTAPLLPRAHGRFLAAATPVTPALSPQALSAAMDRALVAEKGPLDFDVDLGGAAASAAWIAENLAGRRP